MSKHERKTESIRATILGEPAAASGPKRGLNASVGGWHPGARIAVFVMLGFLCGADIWIFTAAKISSLPQLQVRIHPPQLGQVLLSTLAG